MHTQRQAYIHLYTQTGMHTFIHRDRHSNICIHICIPIKIKEILFFISWVVIRMNKK